MIVFLFDVKETFGSLHLLMGDSQIGRFFVEDWSPEELDEYLELWQDEYIDSHEDDEDE